MFCSSPNKVFLKKKKKKEQKTSTTPTVGALPRPRFPLAPLTPGPGCRLTRPRSCSPLWSAAKANKRFQKVRPCGCRQCALSCFPFFIFFPRVVFFFFSLPFFLGRGLEDWAPAASALAAGMEKSSNGIYRQHG